MEAGWNTARHGETGNLTLSTLMVRILHDIVSRRELLGMLVIRNIKIRYKESVLGFLWTLLGPVFLIVIYAIFLRIMKFAMPLPLLVTGIFVWQYLAMSLGDSTNAIVGNANLVKKAAFPRVLLPFSMVLANFVNFLLSLVIVVVYLKIEGLPFGGLMWLPLAMVTQVALCTGVCLFLSSVNVFFRDVQHLMGLITMAWFFMTPVIYPPEMVIQKFSNPLIHQLFYLNPMTGLLALYRAALMGEGLPSATLWGPSLLVSWLVCVIGITVFQRLQRRFADEL
jgi:lipopolysaccharide transport system permease protein